MELAIGISTSAFNRHAFILDNVPREGLADLVEGAVDVELVSIEVGDLLLVTEEGLFECDVKVHIQVVLDALKHVVRLLLQLDYNVALDHVRYLLSLLLVDNLLHILHAFLNVKSESF